MHLTYSEVNSKLQIYADARRNDGVTDKEI